MGLTSIMHRVSGLVMILSLPYLYWWWAVLVTMKVPWGQMPHGLEVSDKIFFSVIILAFLYHFFAGVRHLVMDAGFAEDLKGGRLSAYLTWGVFVITAIIIEGMLWV